MLPTRGRPRSPRVEEAVSAAVHELLGAVGYPALSVEQVAATAGVGKATVYRRWQSKAEMVFALVVHGETVTPPPDTGSLAGDLRALCRHVVALLDAPAAREALPGLLADLRRDPQLAGRFQATFVGAQRELVCSLLDRAAARGERFAALDPADVHAQLLGTVFARLYLVTDPPPADLADRVAGALLATLAR